MWKICVSLVLLLCIQVCAYAPMHPRIGGGVNAQENAWPWMVSLHDQIIHFCGGSLISDEWVLSAAYCFTGVIKDNIIVHLGWLKQRGENVYKPSTTVRRIYIHNLYNDTTEDNNIALLHLSSRVTYDTNVRPVSLIATGSDFPPGTNSTIIGWGKASNRGYLRSPETLQQAVVPVMDFTECSSTVMNLIEKGNIMRKKMNKQPTYKQVTNNMICAGLSCGIDTDGGDSGGPLMSQHNSSWVQHGIISWGLGCASNGAPGVYTRVSQYQQWITEIIGNNSVNDLPQFVNLN